jgi:ABC-type polysaccharide/polyol phosphate export permease
MNMLANRFISVLKQRNIIQSFVVRNLKVKYMDTFLGFLWALLYPLLTIAILYFVFSELMKFSIEHYPFFLCAGVLPWTFFSKTLLEGTMSLNTHSTIALKTNISLEVFPLACFFSNAIEFAVALILFLPIVYVFHCVIPVSVIASLGLVIVFHSAFLIGLIFLFSTAHVFYKDVGHFLTIGLMFWFYITPVFYMIGHMPETVRGLFVFNPMVPFIEGYQSILFFGKLPSHVIFLKEAAIGCVFLFVGWIIFMRKEKDMIKEL